MQIVARVLQPQGVTVGAVNIAENMELVQEMGMFYSYSQHSVQCINTEKMRYKVRERLENTREAKIVSLGTTGNKLGVFGAHQAFQVQSNLDYLDSWGQG